LGNKGELNIMARPKSQSAESSSDVNNELISQLLKKIEELEKKVDSKNNLPDDQDDFDKNKINQDDYIKVISLCPFQLNLTTDKHGQGKVFTFQYFSEVKRILYSDLVRVIDENRSFLESGYFYIMDQRCIRRHGLNELYEKILTKDSIEKILEGKSNDVVSLFKSGTNTQQDLIIEMLISKLANDPDSVDLNLIDKISRASGIKIQEKAEETREFAESLKTNK
jgi:hypothetical protein